jgi:transcriptional regulator with XRE-family HTH domain
MAADQDPTVLRRRLRGELRAARDAAALKQAEVARLMDWSASKLIRIEAGQVSISTNDLRALLTCYGVKDKTRVNTLLELARASRGSSFYDQYADILKAGFREYLAYEDSASVIRLYDPVLISGLLQTEEYAYAILEHTYEVGLEEAGKLWAVRQHRQEMHDRDDPPEVLCVLDEAVLRRQVGRGKVMLRQLERLKEFMAAPHVNIQILPFSAGAHPGMAGNFSLLEFADPTLEDLVHLESVDQITIKDDAELIGKYLDRFAKLEELALPPEESAAFLDEVISDMSATESSTPELEVGR